MKKKKDVVLPNVKDEIKQKRLWEMVELIVTILSSVVGSLLGILLINRLG